MWRLIGALLLFGAIVTAAKIAIIMIVIAGLIFKTKETLGLLFIGGLLTLLGTHPAIGWPLLGLVIILGIVQAWRSSPSDQTNSDEVIEHIDRAVEEHKRPQE